MLAKTFCDPEPENLREVWTHLKKQRHCDKIFKLHVGSMVCLSILRFAESINPLIYTIGSKSLRVEVKKVFGLRTRPYRPKADVIKMKKVTTIT